MYKQTEDKYKTINLGSGTGSIYNYGCYLTSLCNGLNQKGYNFTPEGLNQTLKDKKLWTGPYQNYIDVDNLASKWPEIFTFFDRIDPWGAEPKTDILLNSETVVLGRVSATPIGGTGDHYVLITGVENGVAKIFDPWSGVEELISKRWASFGYILGLRIFKVKEVAKAPILTDQTLLPIIDSNGNSMEVGAVRSKLADQEREITNLKTDKDSLLSQLDKCNSNVVKLEAQISTQSGEVLTTSTGEPVSATASTAIPNPSPDFYQKLIGFIKKLLGI